MDSSKQIIKLIDHKIYYKRNDNLLNHLKTYFQLDQINFSGECYDTHFRIWRYSVWSGLFYSVIVGEICSDNGKVSIALKPKLNSAGLLFSILVFLMFFFGLSSFEFDSITIKNIFLRLFFASLPLIAIRLSYLSQQQKAVKDVQDIIKNVS